MSQHFLLTREAKNLNLAQVFRMTDAQAETMLRNIRWVETDGAPVCPSCGCLNAYECRRPNGAPPVPLSRVQEGLHRHVGNPVCQP